ncbi:peptidoglycan recognition protein family protein [Alloiococcus sp. CFN-8]|uniref:peptidoglycan recognition protein family protein n=1 Tax=Alloiococcus sp. CFN-8 TaxID=3416081 RepID=UPI003CEB5E47
MKKRRKIRKRKRRNRGKRILLMLASIIFFSACILIVIFLLRGTSSRRKVEALKDAEVPAWVQVDLIDIDGAARRGKDLEAIEDIVIHYVGNPGTTAQQNRDFFNNPGVEVSSHFVIGLEGEIIQVIPLNEISQASNWRNNDTISIEVCHPDASGKFSEVTYQSLVKLTAWLTELCDLDEDNVIRHYDVTEKLCPIYYVENEDAWLQLKNDIKEARNN